MLLQGLESLPERCETKTRLARARAGEASPMKGTATDRATQRRRRKAFMKSSFEEMKSSKENLMRPPQEPFPRTCASASRQPRDLGDARLGSAVAHEPLPPLGLSPQRTSLRASAMAAAAPFAARSFLT